MIEKFYKVTCDYCGYCIWSNPAESKHVALRQAQGLYSLIRKTGKVFCTPDHRAEFSKSLGS